MSLSLYAHLVLPFSCSLLLHAEAESQHSQQSAGAESSLFKWVQWFMHVRGFGGRWGWRVTFSFWQLCKINRSFEKHSLHSFASLSNWNKSTNWWELVKIWTFSWPTKEKMRMEFSSFLQSYRLLLKKESVCLLPSLWTNANKSHKYITNSIGFFYIAVC